MGAQSPGATRRQCGPADLTRTRQRFPGSQSGRPGLHDTARSGPGPDPGPTQARPRGRAAAQPGPNRTAAPHPPPSSPFPLSLLPCLHLLDAPTARPGGAYPARRVPRCAHPQRAGGRAHTLTQLQRPWRAPLPAGGCGGPRVTATRGGRRPTGPGLCFPGQGASSGDKPAGGLLLASS